MDAMSGTLARAGAGVVRAAYTQPSACVRGLFTLLVALALLPGAVRATGVHANPYADLPVRKAGLWEVTLQAHAPSGAGGRVQPAMTVLQCTDAKAERIVPLFLLPAREGCQRITVKKNAAGGTHDVSTVCQTHGQRSDMQLTLRGNMQTRYDGTYRVQHPGTPSGNTASVPFEGRWLGRCKPGQRAGDMVLPNGITVNTVDDARRASEHAH
ncbi:hypothetical protein J2X02_000169 [Pseudoxanthomonas japonensis]|uniref:DUF3617 domain-containing protein n=1 Tax=Pseudoxanthomonas japonensis TaxID=69284 RepID=UPI002856E805|nr:DUF3617 family protein [Pseudoxanthomonas japonensis]MDR7067352.1 hypothetical protein [Pseudoxanthomonas japonensis]